MDSSVIRLTQRQSWQDLETFKIFDQLRRIIQPIARMMVRPYFAPVFAMASQTSPPQILEIGAGVGELRQKILADSVPADVRYIESDQEEYLLQQPRKFTSDKMVIELPVVPLEDDAVQLIVGYGVFDTIFIDALSPSMAEIYRVLKPGGKLFHFLDLWPNFSVEKVVALERGFHLAPFINVQQNRKPSLGVMYLKPCDYVIMLDEHFERDSAAYYAALTFLADPFADHETLLDEKCIDSALRWQEVLKRHNVIHGVIPDFPNYVNGRLSTFVQRAGLRALQVGEIHASAIVDETTMDWPADWTRFPNMISSDRGMLQCEYSADFQKQFTGKIKISVTMLVIEAEKPG